MSVELDRICIYSIGRVTAEDAMLRVWVGEC